MFARVRPYLPTAIIALLIIYFGCQALTGDRGLLGRGARKTALAQETAELQSLQAQRHELESRVALLAFLIFYFGFQALTGDRGLLSLSQRNELLAEKRGQLARLQAQRKDLEARARLMRDGAVSRDLVEERARYLLGFADPRDYVIRLKP